MLSDSLDELALVDAKSVRQRADEIFAEMFAVPVDVGFGECTEVARVQDVECCDGLGFLEGSRDLRRCDGCLCQVTSFRNGQEVQRMRQRRPSCLAESGR